MDNSCGTSTIDTPAGNYTLKFYYDDDNPDQPYDEGFVLITHGSRDQIAIQHGDDALMRTVTTVLESSHQRYGYDRISAEALVRWLSLNGRHGATIVDSNYRPVDASTDRDEPIYGVAWAPDDATKPAEYVTERLKEWRAWAAGDAYGWALLDPSGKPVESAWGYYGWDANHEYMTQEATELAQHDAQQRVDAANTAGAGFVGIL